MRRMTLWIAPMIALAAAGCSNERFMGPGRDDNNIVADMVAQAIGGESSGLTAAIGDMLACDYLRVHGDRVGNGLSTTDRKDSTGDWINNVPASFERSYGDAESAWKRVYTFRIDSELSLDDVNDVPGILAEVQGSRTWRRGRLGVRAESTGRLRLNRSESAAGIVNIGGTFEYGGLATTGRPDGDYDSFSVTVTLNKLEVGENGALGNEEMKGRCDVTVNAGGACGLISRSGTLLFNGTDSVLLVMGGRKYIINLHQADIIPLA